MSCDCMSEELEALKAANRKLTWENLSLEGKLKACLAANSGFEAVNMEMKARILTLEHGYTYDPEMPTEDEK